MADLSFSCEMAKMSYKGLNKFIISTHNKCLVEPWCSLFQNHFLQFVSIHFYKIVKILFDSPCMVKNTVPDQVFASGLKLCSLKYTEEYKILEKLFAFPFRIYYAIALRPYGDKTWHKMANFFFI